MMDYCFNVLTNTIDIFYGDRIEELKPGDRFYHNNHTTKIGATLPDYLIIIDFKYVGREVRSKNSDLPYFWINARYENHAVDTVGRMLSSDILKDSNLNPEVSDPEWFFVKKHSA